MQMFVRVVERGSFPAANMGGAVSRRFTWCSKLPAFFAAYPEMAVDMAASESPTTIIEDGFDLAIPGRSQPLPVRHLCRSGSVQPWIFGAGQDRKRVVPAGVFRTSDIEQMRINIPAHLGIAQAPAWLFAAEIREGTVLRLLTPYEPTVPILAVRPAAAACPPKSASSSNTWR